MVNNADHHSNKEIITKTGQEEAVDKEERGKCTTITTAEGSSNCSNHNDSHPLAPHTVTRTTTTTTTTTIVMRVLLVETSVKEAIEIARNNLED